MLLGDHILSLYCERQGFGLLAEPLNALSNLAFFIAAWKLWAETGTRSLHAASSLRLLAGLIAVVGAGSLAFHVFATRWASILDVASIGIFNLCYLVTFLRTIPRWPWTRAMAAAAAYLVVDRATAALMPAGVLNGSGMYLPALTVLVALSGWACRISPETGRMMAAAAGVFVVSLTARTIDRSICDVWPWGTHFLWHMLNAWVLYQLSRALQFGRAVV